MYTAFKNFRRIKCIIRGFMKNTLCCWDNVVLSAYGIWSFSAGDSSAKVAMMNAFINQADYAVFQIVFRYAGYCFFGG